MRAQARVSERPLPAAAEPLLQATGLARRFAVDGGWFRRRELWAVRDVGLDLLAGEVLAVVGESGSGKSTLGQMMLGLMHPSEGHVTYWGEPVATADHVVWRRLRRELQLVFQDAGGALDPRLAVHRQIREPLDIHGLGTPAERDAKASAMAEAVGLGPDLVARHPHQLSGGQLQRAVIARALVLEPKVLVLDEPVAALDVSIRAQIVNLLLDLKRRFGLTYLFISHDLGLVRHLSDRVAVMYLGRVVELGPTEAVFERPRHPYTRALLASIPVPDPRRRGAANLLPGDPPSPIAPPPGCPFHPRCAAAVARCRCDVPADRTVAPGHRTACHLEEPGA